MWPDCPPHLAGIHSIVRGQPHLRGMRLTSSAGAFRGSVVALSALLPFHSAPAIRLSRCLRDLSGLPSRPNPVVDFLA